MHAITYFFDPPVSDVGNAIGVCVECGQLWMLGGDIVPPVSGRMRFLDCQCDNQWYADYVGGDLVRMAYTYISE